MKAFRDGAEEFFPCARGCNPLGTEGEREPCFGKSKAKDISGFGEVTNKLLLRMSMDDLELGKLFCPTLNLLVGCGEFGNVSEG
jgi:hypothetical protein